VADRWSIKSLIRRIVLSRTYQLSSDAPLATRAADPRNLLLARHNRRRLDAESLRDSMLVASGRLDWTPGDGSIVRHRDILVNLAGNLHQASNHRSVYLCYLRSSPPPELAAFDIPDFTTPVGQREVSTVPGQALHLFNSSFVVEQAACFADLICSESLDERDRLRLAFHRAVAREPSAEELEQAIKLIRATAAETDDERQAWISLCQALLVANEFRYVD
jgi:hypothetical protein